MSELQRQLVERNKKEIEKIEEAIKLTKSEIERLEAELKVDEKLFEEKLSGETGNQDSIVKEIIEQVKVNISALGDLLVEGQSKLKELEAEFRILKLRQPILERDWYF